MKKRALLYALFLALISLCLNTTAWAQNSGQSEAEKGRLRAEYKTAWAQNSDQSEAVRTKKNPFFTTSGLQNQDKFEAHDHHHESHQHGNFLHLWLKKHLFKGDLGALYHQGHEIIEHHEGRWFNLKQIVLAAMRWQHLQPENHRWREHIRNFGFMFAFSHGTEVMTLPLSLVYCLVEGGGFIISGQSIDWARCASYLTGSLVISNPGTDPLCWLVFAPYFIPYVNKTYRKFITSLRKASIQFVSDWFIRTRQPEQHLGPAWHTQPAVEDESNLKFENTDLFSSSHLLAPSSVDAVMLLPLWEGSLALNQGLVLFFKKQGQHTYLTRMLWARGGGWRTSKLKSSLAPLGWNVSNAVRRVMQQLAALPEGQLHQKKELQKIINKALHIKSIQVVGSMWQVDFNKALALRRQHRLSLKKFARKAKTTCLNWLQPVDRP